MEHGTINCRACGVVVATCRCIGDHTGKKPVIGYTTCPKCASKN